MKKEQREQETMSGRKEGRKGGREGRRKGGREGEKEEERKGGRKGRLLLLSTFTLLYNHHHYPFQNFLIIQANGRAQSQRSMTYRHPSAVLSSHTAMILVGLRYSLALPQAGETHLFSFRSINPNNFFTVSTKRPKQFLVNC